MLLMCEKKESSEEKTYFNLRLNDRWVELNDALSTHDYGLSDWQGKPIEPRRLKSKLKNQIGLFLQRIAHKMIDINGKSVFIFCFALGQ